MENQEKVGGTEHSKKCCGGWHGGGGAHSGAVYAFGLFGAAVYYIQQAETFGEGTMGILKSLVWPAMLVYKALQYLGM